MTIEFKDMLQIGNGDYAPFKFDIDYINVSGGYENITLSGTRNITFEDCIQGNLNWYKIYGNSVQGKLPDGYTQLDYIENTGDEYIDIKFVPNQDTRVVMDFQLTSSASTGYALFGSRINTTSRGYTFQKVSNG